MDPSTLEKIAEFICGDNSEKDPTYRTGSELTRFFQRAGVDIAHDGTTRKWWTLNTLQNLKGPELQNVILRLASPMEYGSETNKIKLALKTLNEILRIEGLQVSIEGVTPKLNKITPDFNFEKIEQQEERELKPLQPPDFSSLGLESGIDEILKARWMEAQKCVDAKAFLSAIIIMGSMLEGFFLGMMQCRPKEANQASSAPKDYKSGKIKYFNEWKFSEMIEVAHEVGWIELDVKRFSHALRDFRNLIHPYEQLILKTFPDEDTCNISWLVVQAACNDVADYIKKN